MAYSLREQPQLIDQLLRVTLENSAELKASAESLRDPHSKTIEIRDGVRLIRTILEKRGTGDTLTVSVTGEGERAFLRQIRDQWRWRPGGVDADAWNALGDGLAAAGDFADAQNSHRRAADAAHTDADKSRKAAAHFKTFRTACEKRSGPRRSTRSGPRPSCGRPSTDCST